MAGTTSTDVVQGADELIAKLEAMGVSVMTVVNEAAMDGAEVIAERANDLAPHPDILTEFHTAQPGLAEVAIGFPKEKFYYQFFETGATPHEIEAHKAGILAFEAGGEVIFTRMVSHPGMAAEPFLRPAVDEKETAARDAVGDRIVEEIRKYEESA